MTSNRTETTVDWDPANDAVCAAILEAVAEAKDIDSLEISTPLYDVIDPEALDRLFDPTGRNTDRRGGRLTFHYEGCRITVESGGTVTARPQIAEPDDRIDSPPVIGSSAGRE